VHMGAPVFGGRPFWASQKFTYRQRSRREDSSAQAVNVSLQGGTSLSSEPMHCNTLTGAPALGIVDEAGPRHATRRGDGCHQIGRLDGYTMCHKTAGRESIHKNLSWIDVVLQVESLNQVSDEPGIVGGSGKK
jgi:hypothetical protein